MENLPQNQNSQEKPQNFWNNSEQEEIIKYLTIIINGQKNYGKEYSLKDVFSYIKLKTEGRWPAFAVLAALDAFTDRNNTIPTPADLIAILDPVKPRITESEFVEAQKWQERNGFPMFSEARSLIEDYKAQQEGERNKFECKDQRLAEIARSCLKRVGANGEIPDMAHLPRSAGGE